MAGVPSADDEDHEFPLTENCQFNMIVPSVKSIFADMLASINLTRLSLMSLA